MQEMRCLEKKKPTPGEIPGVGWKIRGVGETLEGG